MTARLNLLLHKVKIAMAGGKTFGDAVAGYLLTAAEKAELEAALNSPAAPPHINP